MPTIDLLGTGENIIRLREKAGLTVRDLQNVFGFATPQAIYKWQNGAALPTVDNLVILAAVNGCTANAVPGKTRVRGSSPFASGYKNVKLYIPCHISSNSL